LQLPTGQSCSLQTCWFGLVDPGAHGHEQVGKQTKQMDRGKDVDGGKNWMRAVGMAGKEGKQKPAEQGTAGNTAGRRSVRHRPQETTSRWPASQQEPQLPQMMSACRAVRRGEMQWYWQPGRRVQTYLTCPYPTYRLCLSLSRPTPLICKTQFSPKLTFFFFFFLTSPL